VNRPKIVDDVESLQIQRTIQASPERVFDAWVDPLQMVKWWGPKGVRCLSADVDLRVGGQYRIENELPDGSVLWISGEFEKIARPHLLRYTWQVGSGVTAVEQVTVRFDPGDGGTTVTVLHQRIPGKALRDQHEQGWDGCLSGLLDFFARADAD
jgi:uncharacterized protein YndB with AHSA1/START domain